MPVRTAWGDWLERALRDHGLRPSGLARRTVQSRPGISQVMNGKPALTKLRSEIAAALQFAIVGVSTPAAYSGDSADGASDTSGSLAPVYYPQGERRSDPITNVVPARQPELPGPRLTRTMATTNPHETLNNQPRRIARNVKRRSDGTMVVRWIVVALQEAAKGFLRAHDAEVAGTVDARWMAA